MLLLLDNRDSFTFNLVQVLRELGAEVRVERAAALDVAGVRALAPAALVIGPGPGGPERAGASAAVLRELSPALPTLGVCLGHQVVATAFGGRVAASRDLVHGELRPVEHDGRGLFRGLPSPLEATRYNSLLVDEASLPPELEVSARGPGGSVMGLRHRRHPIESVQFHPESVLCVERGGRDLLRNFLAGVGRL